MYLVLFQPGRRERAWYGTPARAGLTIGSAREDDVQIAGHNIAARHVRLSFTTEDRAAIEVRKPYGVRIDGRLPRGDERLAIGTLVEIGPWHFMLDPAPPTGIEAVDEAFLTELADEESRLVYADSLEERGRHAEAALVRGAAAHDVAALATRAPPEWRRKVLPIAIEGCSREACPRAWRELDDGACARCGRRVVLAGNLATARMHALRGEPVAVDPAVRRWPNDLREPVRKRPAIVMGQPSGAK